jgi:hypothetical protein
MKRDADACKTSERYVLAVAVGLALAVRSNEFGYANYEVEPQ